MANVNTESTAQHSNFARFYTRHTGNDWQRLLARLFLLVAAVALLGGVIAYAVTFWHTNSHDAAEGLIIVAIAKLLVTALLILDTRGNISFGGPALVIIGVLLGAALLPCADTTAAPVAIFSVTILIASLLYGVPCAIIPAVASAVCIIGFLAIRLQRAMEVGQTHAGIDNMRRSLIVIGILASSAIIGSVLHPKLRRRLQPRNIKNRSVSMTIPVKANQLKTADLTLNTATRIVRRGDQTIVLRRKEYEILAFLLKNKGTVVAKETLLKTLWSKQARPDGLSVHIKRLRDQVDKPFSVPLIETLHGVGYRIKDLP